MRTVHDLGELERGTPVILTLGAFDGVHRGHQFLIRQVVDRARAQQFDAAVLTFDPRPTVVLRPGSAQLTAGEEKARLLGALGPDILVVLPFDEALSQVSAGQFLVQLLDHINVREVWVGADFAFGHNREGNIDFLLRAGTRNHFAVHVVPREALNGDQLSSSAVREAIATGDVARAALLLGHFFAVPGRVVHGAGRGRGMGFPTANLQPPAHQILPATGIYAAFVRRGEERIPAAVSVGYNPTFGESDEVKVEAFLLDFDGDLTGEELAIDFVERIREERTFERPEDLVAEMERDVARTREILAGTNEPGELLLPA